MFNFNRNNLAESLTVGCVLGKIMFEIIECTLSILVGSANNDIFFSSYPNISHAKSNPRRLASLLNAEKYSPKSLKSKLFSALLNSTTSFSLCEISDKNIPILFSSFFISIRIFITHCSGVGA